jgi:hypothetical protein
MQILILKHADMSAEMCGKMKNRKSIGVFAGVVGAVVIFLAVTGWNLKKSAPLPKAQGMIGFGCTVVQKAENQLAESMAVQKPESYILGILDGKLVVFWQDGRTVFFDTGIRSSELSQELLDRIAMGIYFTDEKLLFEFLENCSS